MSLQLQLQREVLLENLETQLDHFFEKVMGKAIKDCSDTEM